MTPEELLEEIMLLSEAERSALFGLMRARPVLRRQMEKPTAPPAEVSAPEVPTVVDSTPDYLIIWDGGSKGNPGLGYGSYQLTSVKNGKSRIEKLEFPGQMTNNEAEYETLIGALDTLARKIRERGRDPAQYHLDLRGDSLLVINQILGKWKAKDERMAAYRDRVRQLLKQFGAYTIRHHDRRHSVAALGH
ncbi:MAG: ribonuclease HI family protein [Ardenticatenales bacterium]|nr:ribonuclease HI family protein [Ardenticatenales bacterium]